MSRRREYSIANYLKPAYHRGDMGKLIRRAVPKLKTFRKKHPFDAIAFRGYSGASVAAILSWEMNIPMIAVRKDSSHDYKKVFGLRSVESYIIVDDFLETGETIYTIIDEIQEFIGQFNGGKRVILAGVFCYDCDYARPERKLNHWCRYFEGHIFKNVKVMYL